MELMRPEKVTDGTYVITVRGAAGSFVRAAFDDMEVSAAGDTTVLRRGPNPRLRKPSIRPPDWPPALPDLPPPQ